MLVLFPVSCFTCYLGEFLVLRCLGVKWEGGEKVSEGNMEGFLRSC